MPAQVAWITVAAAISIGGVVGRVIAAQDILYATDSGNIVSFTPAGVRSAVARLSPITGMAFDASGNLFVARTDGIVGSHNSIQKITPDGAVSVFADVGANNPQGLAFDAAGNLYASYFNVLTHDKIVRFTPAGVESTFIDGGLLFDPHGITFDQSGNLYVTNEQALNSAVIKYTSGGVGSVIADAHETFFADLAFDSHGDLFVTGSGILRIKPDGASGLFVPAGIGDCYGIAIDQFDNIFASQSSNRIIKVTPGGAVSTFSTSAQGYVEFQAPEPSSAMVLTVGVAIAIAWRARRPLPVLHR